MTTEAAPQATTATYIGRRADQQSSRIAYAFRLDTGREVQFGKMPRTAKGWPMGTVFAVTQVSDDTWTFQERTGTSLGVQPQDLLEDRAAQVAVDAKKQKAQGKALSDDLLDSMTIREVREYLTGRPLMPDHRRAAIAVVLERLGVRA